MFKEKCISDVYVLKWFFYLWMARSRHAILVLKTSLKNSFWITGQQVKFPATFVFINLKSHFCWLFRFSYTPTLPLPHALILLYDSRMHSFNQIYSDLFFLFFYVDSLFFQRSLQGFRLIFQPLLLSKQPYFSTMFSDG